MFYVSSPTNTNHLYRIPLVYILSPLGKWLETDLNKSIESFTNLLETQKGYSHWYASFAVNYTLFMDNSKYLPQSWRYDTIDSYKMGLIDTETFVSKMATQLGLDYSKAEICEGVKDAWNAMTVIDPEFLSKIIPSFTAGGFGIIVTSNTTPLHVEHIIKQFDGYNIKVPIIFSTSYEQHTSDPLELAKLALEQNPIDKQRGIEIISDSFTQEELGIESTNFHLYSFEILSAYL